MIDKIQNISAHDVPHGFTLIHPDNHHIYMACQDKEGWILLETTPTQTTTTTHTHVFTPQEHTPPSFYTQYVNPLPPNKIGRPPKKNNADKKQHTKNNNNNNNNNAYISFFQTEMNKINQNNHNMKPQMKMHIIAQKWKKYN